MTRHTRVLLGWALTCTVAALLTGCLKRKETITVTSDGGVNIVLDVEGESKDVEAGDALPTNSGGWSVTTQTEKNDKGEEKTLLHAEYNGSPREDLPETYTDDREALRAVLHFPTTVKVEHRSDGTYYHFHRVYVGRAQARYEYWKKLVDPQTLALAGKDPNTLSEEQLVAMFDALKAAQMGRVSEYVSVANVALGDRWPQDEALQLLETVRKYFTSADTRPLHALFRRPPGPERDAKLAEFGDRLMAGVRPALDRALGEAGASGRERGMFWQAYEREERNRTVTEDLGDEVFEIRVKLPGQIVAHNGDKLDDDGSVVWEFKGDALNDRDQVLMVSSREE
jgi:hypothetical protein